MIFLSFSSLFREGLNINDEKIIKTLESTKQKFDFEITTNL
jgi:hypothetical protein